VLYAFFAELREKHDVDDAVLLIDGTHSLKDACCRHSLDFRYELMEIRVLSNVSFER